MNVKNRHDNSFIDCNIGFINPKNFVLIKRENAIYQLICTTLEVN